MARSLSNIEYATFMTEVQPDSMSLPQWGGVVQWGAQYILMFKMPSGEWALSDITDGIPYGNTVIDAATYLATVPRNWVSTAGVFLFSLPQNFIQNALQRVADAGSLASGAIQWTSDQLRTVLQGVTGGISAPFLIAAVVIVALLYGPKLLK